MPLLDIAIAQSSVHNYLVHSRVQRFVIGTVPHNCLSRHGSRWLSFQKSFQNAGNLNFNLGHLNKKSNNRFLVEAVATLEPKCFIKYEDDEKKSNALPFTTEPPEDSDEIDEREKLRRIRISKANKGNTPWNKGRKHSPETLQRIRERTRLAMQNPKVKMKLANVGHAQSQETRKKIGVRVRMGWQKRREKLLLQETCLFDWQNLIAETARHGFQDEEELQWDSYKIMDEQLQEEWLASIENRKAMPRPKGSRRAPKSLEQRRKIAEAIAAKWADPEYRSRVRTGLAKYHGIPEGAERRVRKKRSDGSQTPRTPVKRVTSAKKPAPAESKVKAQQPKLKKRTTPKYKDPLANSKLEMLKSIRAQRVTSETKKNEALERAKLLIREAEKAAKALEITAMRNPVALASLIEARQLIAEATQSIKSIENEEVTSEDELMLSTQNHVETDERPIKALVDGHHRGVNGTHIGLVHESNSQNPDINIYRIPVLEDLDLNHHSPDRPSGYEFPKLDFGSFIRKSESRALIDQEHLREINGSTKLNGLSNHNVTKLQIHEEEQISDAPLKTATKKWVRGRLVEVSEGQ